MFKGITLIAVISLLSFMTTIAQVKPTEKQLENVLTNFLNYRFGKVTVYEVGLDATKKVTDELKKIQSQGSGAIQLSQEELTKYDNALLADLESYVQGGLTFNAAVTRLRSIHKLPPQNELQKLFNHYKALMGGGSSLIINNVYLITTIPSNKDAIPNEIIAMIIHTADDEGMDNNLNSKGQNEIFTHDELTTWIIETTTTGSTVSMYDYLKEDVLYQKNFTNLTPEARGIGKAGLFIPISSTQSLIKEGPNVSLTQYDIQKFKRISEQQPFYMFNRNFELVISPDLISIKKYPDLVANGMIDTAAPKNFSLPQWGVELKYGQEAINYPSFWSERLTAYAVWDRVKLGVVLPTAGWASLSADAFEQERKLTHAGIGIAGEADFATKFIPESGVFNFNFSYLFGDAQESEYKNRELDPDIYVENIFDNDYLVRGHAQLHYTYGLMIEENYWLRLGVGGTYYAMERWYNKVEEDEETFERSIVMAKRDEESIGGVSAKLDFMAKDLTTPFGLTLQYFDEGMFTDIWLHIPIVQDMFAMRLSAKGYFKAFTDQPREWENSSVFIPMARFIVNF